MKISFANKTLAIMRPYRRSVMFSKEREPSRLEREIDRVLRELLHHPIGSEEYVKALDQVVKMHRMKEEEKPDSVSKDTLVNAGANLLGLVMILKHERAGVILSKAMMFIARLR